MAPRALFLLPLVCILLPGTLGDPYPTDDPNFKPFDTGYGRDRLTKDKAMDVTCTRAFNGTSVPIATFKGVFALASDNLIYRGVEKTNYLRLFIYRGSPEGQKEGLSMAESLKIGSFMSTQFGTAAGTNAFVLPEREFSISDEYNGKPVFGWVFKPTDYVFVSGTGNATRRWYDAVGSIPKRYWPKNASGDPVGSRPSERLIAIFSFPGPDYYVKTKPQMPTMGELHDYIIDTYGTKTITNFAYGSGFNESTPVYPEGGSGNVTCVGRLYIDYDSNFQVWTPIFCSIMFVIATVMIIVFKCVKRRPSAVVVAETEKLREARNVSRRGTKVSGRSSGEEAGSAVAPEPDKVQETSS